MLILFSILSIAQIQSTIRFNTDSFKIVDTTIEGRTYSQLFWDKDFNHDETVGYPELKHQSFSFIIPFGYELDSIEILNPIIKDYYIDNTIKPEQPDFPSCIGCPIPGFIPDTSSVYLSDLPFPANITGVVTSSIYNNCKILTIPITPFAYRAMKHILTLYSSFDLLIHLKPGSIPFTERKLMKLSRNAQIARNTIIDLVVNKRDYEYSSQPLTIVDSIDNSRTAVNFYEYIILSSSTFEEKARELVEWKRKKGFDAGFVNVEDIYANYTADDIGNIEYQNNYSIDDNAGRIRKYLQEAFANGAQWLLIVGDETVVPIRIQTGPSGRQNPTDKYYGNFTSDYEVDGNGNYGEIGNGKDNVTGILELFVGRIPCNSIIQFNNWLSKLYIYEQDPGNGQTDYLTQCLGIQGDQWQFSDDYTNIFESYTNSFNTHYLFQEKQSYSASGTDLFAPYGADIINYYNQHPPYLWIWLNHGLFDRVQTMSDGINSSPRSNIYITDSGEPGAALSNLTNEGKPGIVYASSCYVAAFQEEISGASMCMAESYLINNASGGICFMGGTNELGLAATYVMENYFASSLNKIALGRFDYLTHLGSNYFYWMNKFHLQSPYNSDYFTHNLFGDPEARLFTKTPIRISANVKPRHIEVNTPTNITINMYNIAHNDTVYVALYGENFNNGNPVVHPVTGTGSITTFTVTDVSVADTGPLYVTITGFNYLPFTDEILVSPGCNFVSTNENITVTPVLPWSGTLFKDHNVVIKTGVTLTIVGKVYFVPGAKLIIEPGGKVMLDGGLLGASCEQQWRGVEVWGQHDMMQVNSYQGEIDVSNGGSINDAICGILTAKGNINGYDVYNTGGIIKCDNAHFVNDKIAVSYHPYLYRNWPNMGDFKNTEFQWNNDYLLPAVPSAEDYPIAMAHLNGINILSFNNCKFNNLMTTSQFTTIRGNGIYALNSRFTVFGDGGQPRPSHIEGFYYGIYAISGFPTSFKVEYTDFINNLRGIYLSQGYSVPIIHRNHFLTHSTDMFNPPSSAIYLDGCTGYSVQENSIEGHYSATTGNTYETGIVINNSGAASNEIYNNTFKNIQNGITAQDDNRGLVCKCNDYTGVKTDQSVLITGGSSNSIGIALYQGDGLSVSGPAGNTFSMRTSGKGDIYNQGVKFNYYHHRNIGQYRLKPEYYEKVDLIPFNFENYTKQAACPSKLGGGGGINQQQIKDELASSGIMIDLKQDSLAALIDGGNTQETTEDVVYSSPQEALDLRDDLLAKSPYLSDTVMQSVAANEYVLPNVMVRDILVANPQSATSDPVLDELDERADPMPDEMYNQILDGEFIVSPKETKEAELASLKLSRETNYNTLVSYYIADTTAALSDSLDQLLLGENKPEAKYLLACKQLNEVDTVAASITLSTIPATFNLSTAEMTRHENYLSYFAVVGSMEADTLPGSECDSLQLTALTLLMQEGCEPVSSYARNLLIAIDAVTYNEPYLVADELKSARVKRERRNVTTPIIPLLTLSPNPCRYFVIAGYSLEDNLTSDAFLTISTLQGVEIKTIQLIGAKDQVVITLNNFSPGVYVASLKAGGTLIDSKKIIIVK